MRRPSVKVALTGITVLIAVLFAGFATNAVLGINDLNDAAQELAENWLPSVKVSGNIETDVTAYRLAMARRMLANSDKQAQDQDTAMKATDDAVQADIAAYRPLISSDKERQVLDAISQQFDSYKTNATKVIELLQAGKRAESIDLFYGPLVADGTKVVKSVKQLVEINVAGSRASRANADKVYSGASTVMIVSIVIVAVVLAGTIVFIIFGVANPIGRITLSMRNLAEGDSDTAIPFAGRHDEIGSMATAVEVFRQAAISNKRLEREAEAARQQAEADRIVAQERAEADAAERLRIATSGLAAGLKRLAAGDLAFQLNEAFAPDFEALRHDFNSSVKQLGETLSTISESIGTLDNGTREISSGARDLSKRTEQQAASLEETAAALDEITANVANSTKRTDETRTLANQANQSAVKSAEIVSQAEEAMRKIENSSQQISNIIGVIDEIAFQTNLLALNAGVEAARAGEAGKGFAVVAQEVRELAQRSAKAAKEIKELIQNSTVQVEGGVKLVRDTGAALGTICTYIGDINRHIDSISTSAREQSTGLAEVNTAVNSMDQTTQQNAAMVEQSTAASSSLAMEAERLRNLVSRFTLNEAGHQTALLRQTARTMAEPSRAPTPMRRPAAKVASAGGSRHTPSATTGGDWEEF